MTRCPAALAGSTAAALLPDAQAYTRVRALGMPAALAFMVLQAAFLGARDWRRARPTRDP